MQNIITDWKVLPGTQDGWAGPEGGYPVGYPPFMLPAACPGRREDCAQIKSGATF